ncbi:hypothetical protein ACH3XW_4640 [Acanthocheilonema viteae]
MFRKYTGTFNVTNPMYFENIKPNKILEIFEDAFKEVLAQVQNETYSMTDGKKSQQLRHRRLCSRQIEICLN